MRICFFARVPSPAILDTVNFYADDLRALEDLGCDVVRSTRFRDIPPRCDLYFAWWWSWAFLPMIRARAARRPLVITGVFDDAFPLARERAPLARPWWKRAVLRAMLHGADANIFLSRYEFERMQATERAPRSWCIPLGVDTNRYRPGTRSREPFLLNVAWSGALNARRKCLAEIITALPAIRERHPDVRLVMAGRQGEYHPNLVELANRLGVGNAVDFLGVIPEETKIDLMQRCAVYLQPTLGEGFGLAIAEAMACGAPVVSTPSGAVSEVVGPCGLLPARPGPDLIASAVSQLLSDEHLAASLGHQAAARIRQQFGYERRRDGLARVIAAVR